MLARIFIALLLILTVVTTYTQTHHTTMYHPYHLDLIKNPLAPKAASAKTQEIHKALLAQLPFDTRDD